MNRFESEKKPSETIRSEIDQTRSKMDTTIDALSERLKGRHLVDELLGFLRGNGNASSIKEKVTESTNATVHAVVDAVKAHPLPILVMGAGLAWLIYENSRKDHDSASPMGGHHPEPEPLIYPTGSAAGYEAPFDSPVGPSPGVDLESGSPFDTLSPTEQARSKAGEVKDRVMGKASHLGDQARSTVDDVRARASRAGSQVRESTRELAAQTRDMASRTGRTISRAAQEHPLEVGLTCLAAGLIAGLVTPAPAALRENLQPTATRLKESVHETGEDLMQRGKRVVQAAAEAARGEAETQGITPQAVKERIRQAAGSPEASQNTEAERESEHRDAMSGNEQRIAADIVQPQGGASERRES